MVGNYNADFYVINGMVLETRKRREHLSTDDLRKNKALLENFAKGNAEYLEQQNGKHYFLQLLEVGVTFGVLLYLRHYGYFLCFTSLPREGTFNRFLRAKHLTFGKRDAFSANGTISLSLT